MTNAVWTFNYPFTRYAETFGTWTTVTGSSTTNVRYCSVVGVGTDIYIIGGQTSASYKTTKYDTLTGETTELSNYITSRNWSGITYYDGKIYVVAGGTSGVVYGNLQIYDIASNTWTTGAVVPTNRDLPIVHAYNNKIYVIAGKNTNAVDIYDISSNTWSLGANCPGTGQAGTSALVDNEIHVIGLYYGSTNGNHYVYNIDTDSWTTLSDTMPNIRTHSTGGLYKNRIISIGGGSNIIEGYDLIKKEWIQYPNLPEAATIAPNIVVVGNKIYAFPYVAGKFYVYE